ncbi:MAG: phosphopentomutase [Firmicutes bacterium]|nr:phosphopentomutase [Alicyclobacillaceae bacterium]MCL6496698.1 phosphopentomutase [Bacillota bacterium]
MRLVWVVLDSVGIGAAPDADAFGDAGANTVAHVLEATGVALPHLEAMGLGALVRMSENARGPVLGRAFRVHPEGRGKDSLAGHWEMAGLSVDRPFPVYPHGFPPEVVAALEQALGVPILANAVGSGTALLEAFGPEHLATGRPIVYTSADSVLQIAAHEAVVPREQLYAWCESARRVMDGPHRVGRVIARPFTGSPGRFVRTAGRHDWVAEPPGRLLPEHLQAMGVFTLAIGKIADLYAHRGFSHTVATADNAEGIAAVTQALKCVAGPALIQANLVDFDSRYGHRRDSAGYARALAELDQALPTWWDLLSDDDQLWITADHGCDPTFRGTDHTREDVPWLVFGRGVKPGRGGIRYSLRDLGATAAALFGAGPWPGQAANLDADVGV